MDGNIDLDMYLFLFSSEIWYIYIYRPIKMI